MKLRFQSRRYFGSLSDGELDLFVCVRAKVPPGWANSQHSNDASNASGDAQQQQFQPKAPNAMRPGINSGNPGANLNNLPPRAIERLQDMPPDQQERFLQNNQRFQNLPPEQQARIRQRLQAWNRLTPSQQQEFARTATRVGAD